MELFYPVVQNYDPFKDERLFTAIFENSTGDVEYCITVLVSSKMEIEFCSKVFDDCAIQHTFCI